MRPDSKSQVTLEYNDNNKPVRIDAIVISTQHDDFDTEAKMLAKDQRRREKILIPRVIKKYPQYKHLFNNQIKYHINPTGKFVIGGLMIQANRPQNYSRLMAEGCARWWCL